MHTWVWMLLSSLGLGVCYAANIPPIAMPTNGIEISSSIIDALSYRQNDTNVGSDSGKYIKIVGGSDAKLGDAPWQVFIEMDQGSELAFACGGTLLSKRVVVTAAHCLLGGTSKDVTVALGALVVSDMPQIFGVKQQFVHEQWISSKCGGGSVKPFDCSNDIAVLILDKDATLGTGATPTVQIANLPAPLQNDDVYLNKNVLTSGWGVLEEGDDGGSTVLQKAEMTILAQTTVCSADYNNSDVVYNQQLMLCAGGGTPPNYERAPCQGDSGGPLVYTENKANLLWGITSWAKGCALYGYPNVFTRVTNYVIWIKEKACLGGYCLPA